MISKQFIKLTLVGSENPIYIRVDQISYLIQGPSAPGDGGVTIVLTTGKEIGVLEEASLITQAIEYICFNRERKIHER